MRYFLARLYTEGAFLAMLFFTLSFGLLVTCTMLFMNVKLFFLIRAFRCAGIATNGLLCIIFLKYIINKIQAILGW